MGQGGIGPRIWRTVVLDAGALIAVERDDRRVRSLLKGSVTPQTELIIPAIALAQSWRGGSRAAPMVKWIEKSEVDSLDEARAKQTGERLGSRDTSDVSDAHVICCAVERDAVVKTVRSG